MKQLNTRILLSTALLGLGGLGLLLASAGAALAKQKSQSISKPTQQPQAAHPADAFERVQLEEQLIRSDAQAVMFGQWLLLREAGGDSQ